MLTYPLEVQLAKKLSSGSCSSGILRLCSCAQASSWSETGFAVALQVKDNCTFFCLGNC